MSEIERLGRAKAETDAVQAQWIVDAQRLQE